ncbi:hypothetical protein A11A3_05961 [Alcanivorax hongdengensis A-11-3]|uniref:DUF3108 domain-containing protein n=1 Tax=Alcanivorax hongdengensis A-11-3 TaxID=1177179 RepID=L0WGN7_9GAMM|nr:DUF3108 domain-containing protein [Alcanivorax hongdengensis]EKF74975.1 hypothetical protein A11A3_05961 [Alcanivorax hongdengensis A-11-3]
MASLYRNRVTSTFSLLIISMAFGSPALADSPVAAFTEHYRLKSQGIPFTIDATRTLSPVRDGLWEMQVHARNWLGEIRETALFSWDGCTPQTSYYGYMRKGLGRVKKAEVHINQETGVAVSERSGKADRSYPVRETATDQLSLTLALQCELQQGKTDITLPVADERKLQTERFQVVGHETLELGDTRIKTVKVQRQREADSDRQTYMWFAPQRGFALVQLVQQNADGTHTMTLTDD